jgi:chromosome segregation ATPase
LADIGEHIDGDDLDTPTSNVNPQSLRERNSPLTEGQNGSMNENIDAVPSEANGEQAVKPMHQDGDSVSPDTERKLAAMLRDRDALREEVTELRKALEEIQRKHQEDSAGLQEQLHQSQAAKENAESQYRTLLGKVNTIKAQLGERLKSDAVSFHQLMVRQCITLYRRISHELELI